MAYASRLGRARVSPSSPQAAGICDRCGTVYSRVALSWQFDYRGRNLTNLRLLVCRDCTDKPFLHHIPIFIPADPIPIKDPRPENYTVAEALDTVTFQNDTERDFAWVDDGGNEFVWTVPVA